MPTSLPHRLPRSRFLVLATLASFANFASPTFAAETSLEGFIDGVVSQAIVNGQSVGATVSLVQNGRLLLAKGYGEADRLRGLPVRGRETQFRIGSITKVLVWISVLQQVEAGRLDLDADVNTYLTSFEIDDSFPEPITLRHLMTHTPGFEDSLVNLFATGPRQVGELGEVLEKNQPARVRLPGTVVSYSNYGAALAAYIVANVTQTAWDEYVERNILKPLSMATATTRQPVPEAIERTRSRGYEATGDRFVERGFAYVPLGPAGSGTATALDLARLMVELLNPRGTGVLSAESKALLLNGAYVVHPLVNGMTLGMYEMSQGPARAVGHGGNILWFQSQMILWPDERMGLFVSTNGSSAQPLVDTLVRTLGDRLGFRARNDSWIAFTGDERVYAGDYVAARRAHTDFTKLVALGFAARVDVDLEAEELIVNSSEHYKKIAEGAFQRIEGPERIAFTRSGDQVTGFALSTVPTMNFERAAPQLTLPFNLALAAGWALLLAAALLVWPFSSFTHRAERRTAGERLATGLALLSGLVVVAFGWRLADVAGSSDADFLLRGIHAVPGLLWMPAAFVALVALQLVYVYRAWAGGYWWPMRRVHYSLLYFAHVGLAWAVWYWNLLPANVLALAK